MSFKIESAYEKSVNAAENWKRQYCTNGKWSTLYDDVDSETIYNKILEAQGNPAKVAEAIGNNGWSYISCSNCQSDKLLFAVVFGNYDDTVTVCLRCLSGATAALEALSKLKELDQ